MDKDTTLKPQVLFFFDQDQGGYGIDRNDIQIKKVTSLRYIDHLALRNYDICLLCIRNYQTYKKTMIQWITQLSFDELRCLQVFIQGLDRDIVFELLRYKVINVYELAIFENDLGNYLTLAKEIIDRQNKRNPYKRIKLEELTRSVILHNAKVPLSFYEYKILEVLLNCGDQVINLMQITETLRKKYGIRTSVGTVQVTLSRLKRKIRLQTGSKPICNLHGQGYYVKSY